MKLVYFAWVRERVGKTEEQIDPPPERGDSRSIDGVARRTR